MIATRGEIGGQGDGGRQKLDGEVGQREGEGVRRLGLELGEDLGFGECSAGAAELAEVVGEEGFELCGVFADGGVEEALFEVLEGGR